MTDNERIIRLQSHELHGVLPETLITSIEWEDEGYQKSAEKHPLYAYITVKDGTLTLQHDIREEFIAFDSVQEIDIAIALLQQAREMMGED